MGNVVFTAIGHIKLMDKQGFKWRSVELIRWPHNNVQLSRRPDVVRCSLLKEIVEKNIQIGN